MERLDGTVRRALRSAGVPDAGVLAEVTRVWPDAVGPAIAAAAWPQRLGRDGTLHVNTTSSTWAFELDRMGEEVLRKLRAELGGATPPALRFAPGPVPAAGAPEPVERHVAVTPADEDEAASLTSAIDDPALREAVRKAVAASLAAARHDRTV
jgi:predicted nucleic acid-binding Zn ribbon protein